MAALWAVGSALAFSVEGLFAHGALAAGATVLGAIASRYGLAAAVAWAVLAARGAARRLAWRDEARLALAGAFGYGTTTTLLFAAFGRIPTSLAIAVLYSYPVLVALGAHALGRERLTAATAAAVGVAVVGVALITAPSGGAEVGGVALALGAAATNAATILATEPVLERVSAWAGTARLALGASVATGAAAVLTGRAVLPPPAALADVAALALGPTLAAVVLLNRSLQQLGATRTAVIATLEPLFAGVWGLALLGERLGTPQWAGALLTVAGATAVAALPHRR